MIKKSIGELIDGLSIVNIKSFYLVDKVKRNKHTKEDARKIQVLNKQRNEFMNSINEYFGDREEIKV